MVLVLNWIVPRTDQPTHTIPFSPHVLSPTNATEDLKTEPTHSSKLVKYLQTCSKAQLCLREEGKGEESTWKFGEINGKSLQLI